MSDETLLESIARGDRRALELLYAAYRPRLVRFLSRLAPRSQNVDEIVNDTLMVVWQQAGRFCYSSKVSTWIFGIAYRVAMKSLRQSKRWENSGFELEQRAQATDPTVEWENLDWLNQGLHRLSRKHRSDLLLVHYWGHSIAEVSATTKTLPGTVKSRLFHARERMRAHLIELCA